MDRDIVTNISWESFRGISHLLKPLDDAINTFIKILLQGNVFSPNELALPQLPVKYDEMGLIIPTEICHKECKNFQDITKRQPIK